MKNEHYKSIDDSKALSYLSKTVLSTKILDRLGKKTLIISSSREKVRYRQKYGIDVKTNSEKFIALA